MSKARQINNYPGFPAVSGRDLAVAFEAHLRQMEIPVTEDRITAVYAMGKSFSLQGASGEMYSASAVILAAGVTSVKPLPGEEEFLGMIKGEETASPPALPRREGAASPKEKSTNSPIQLDLFS